jgi:valine--pyruvate aminotransferase
MNLSNFGHKFSTKAGITQLMEDLGAANAAGDMLMLGGGNPAHLPEIQSLFRQRMQSILNTEGAFETLIGNYDGSRGNAAFIQALATLLSSTYGWEITPDHITLTNGSQNAFFCLFNLFAGTMPDGSHKKILFPLAPEYIGYTDAGLSPDFFTARRPVIERLPQRHFKYHIDFNALNIGPDIGAICLSRPTNPTGNVLTDDEIIQLDALARKNGIPLIIDGAYGTPFPNAIYTEASPHWTPNTILCLSLSKFGLPNLRTGIVIAPPAIAEAVAEFNGVMALAPGGAGARLAQNMVESGDILTLSRDLIKPTYQRKSEKALDAWHSELRNDIPWQIHKPEGAFFHWLWFNELPIPAQELYQRLKARKTLIIPGHHFFPGLESDDWSHKHQCIRVTYAGPDEIVQQGIAVIAEEVNRLY